LYLKILACSRPSISGYLKGEVAGGEGVEERGRRNKKTLTLTLTLIWEEVAIYIPPGSYYHLNI